MSEHQIKLVASLDTSGINPTSTGTTASHRTSSGGSSTIASSAMIGSSVQMASFIKSVQASLQTFHHQLKRISMPMAELVREFNKAHQHIKGINNTFSLYNRNMMKNQESIGKLGSDFSQSLKVLSSATISASNSIRKASLAANAGKASGFTGLLGKQIGSGGGFGELFGRMVGAGAVMSAYSGTRQIFDITDP